MPTAWATPREHAARASASRSADDRDAGARDRPRCDGAQPRSAWPPSRARTQRAAAAAREDAQERGDRAAADGTPARSASACRRSARPRRWRPPASPTSTSATRSIDPAKLARVAALAGRVRARDRGRLARSASSASRAALRAARQPRDRRVRRDRRRPGPLRRRAGRRRRARAAGARRTTACASPACRPTTAGHSTCAARPSARRRSRHAVRLARARAGQQSTAAGIACPLVTGAGTGTLRLRGRERRLRRAAGRQLPVHGPRLRRQRAGARGAALRARAVREEPGDEPRRLRTRWSTPATSRMPSTRGLPRVWRRDGLDYVNGGDEHGILRPRRWRSGGAAAGARRDGLAGARPLRPDREPARPLRRRARRARARRGRGGLADRRARLRQLNRAARDCAHRGATGRGIIAPMEGAQIIVLATPVFLLLIAIECRRRPAPRPQHLPAARRAHSIGLGIMSQIVGVFTKLADARHLRARLRARSRSGICRPTRPGSGSPACCSTTSATTGGTASATPCALLWAAHVVHHQSEDYNLSTALRQTLERLGRRLAVLPAAGVARRAAAGLRRRRADRPALPVLGAHAADRPPRLVRPLVLRAVQPSRAPRRQRALPRPQLRRHADRLGPPVRHLPGRGRRRALRLRHAQPAAQLESAVGQPARSSRRCRTTAGTRGAGATSCGSGSSRRAGGRPTSRRAFRGRRSTSPSAGATSRR